MNAHHKITLAGPVISAPSSHPTWTRPSDEPWRQSVVAKPVLPPKTPRFDAMAFTPQQMIEAVAKEQDSASFKNRWSRHAPNGNSMQKARDGENQVAALITGEMICSDIARAANRSAATVASILDRLVRSGIVVRRYSRTSGSNRQIGHYRLVDVTLETHNAKATP